MRSTSSFFSQHSVIDKVDYLLAGGQMFDSFTTHKSATQEKSNKHSAAGNKKDYNGLTQMLRKEIAGLGSP
jgi:hypothetical protein